MAQVPHKGVFDAALETKQSERSDVAFAPFLKIAKKEALRRFEPGEAIANDAKRRGRIHSTGIIPSTKAEALNSRSAT